MIIRFISSKSLACISRAILLPEYYNVDFFCINSDKTFIIKVALHYCIVSLLINSLHKNSVFLLFDGYFSLKE